MARRSAFVLFSFAACLGVGMLGGCNEVLDIEEAHLGASGGPPSGQIPVSSGIGYYPGQDTCQADVSPACSACTQTCAGALSSCQQDKNCRKYMARYNGCLGQACTPNVGVCFEEGLFDPLSPVNSCLDKCGEGCAPSPILTSCQLYCGCMMQNCGGKFSSVDECVQKCKTEDPAIAACRWTHCEIAPDDLATAHCDHAVGTTFCTDGDVPVRPDGCRDKSLPSYYCQQDDDCCSGRCDTSRKACH